MTPIEMFKIIIKDEWHNTATGEVCSFSWSEDDESIIIEYKTGNRTGQKQTHRGVKIYSPKKESQEKTLLQFQSNLFTSVFTLKSESGPLWVDSELFGKMELVRK